MRIKIVMNPWSDRQRSAKRIDTIRSIGEKYGGVEVVLTEGPGHGQELAKEAAAAGYDVVAAAGGDGTAHEVINGLLAAQTGRAKFGIIPIGTGNDLAFALGIPLGEPEEALRILFHGRLRSVDLGLIEAEGGRSAYFHNNVGIGTDAVVVMRTEAITRLHGFPLYLAAVFQTIAFHYRTLGLQLQFDDLTVSQDALLVALGIGPRHGGGFLLTPDAVSDDNLIDSCTAEPMGRFTMLALVARSLRGRHVDSKRVAMRKSKRISVVSDVPMPIHADGEMFAYPENNIFQVTVSSVPAGIEVVV